MPDREKNLLFLGCGILLLTVLFGTAHVDSSLTRMILPEQPFSTAVVKYDHGITLEGNESKLSVKGLKIVTLSADNESLIMHTHLFHTEIPFVITWGSIEKIMSIAGMLTK